jgi:hypothetical protein
MLRPHKETHRWTCSGQCPLEDRIFLLHKQVWDIGAITMGIFYTSNGALGTPPMANTATSITSGTVGGLPLLKALKI